MVTSYIDRVWLRFPVPGKNIGDVLPEGFYDRFYDDPAVLEVEFLSELHVNVDLDDESELPIVRERLEKLVGDLVREWT